MKFKIFLFVILFFLSCEKNDDFSNLTPHDLYNIKKKTFDLGYKLISLISLNSNFTFTLANIEVKYLLFFIYFLYKKCKR